MKNVQRSFVLNNNIVDLFESIEDLLWDIDDIEETDEEEFEEAECIEAIRYYESDERNFDEEFIF